MHKALRNRILKRFLEDETQDTMSMSCCWATHVSEEKRILWAAHETTSMKKFFLEDDG